MRSVIHFKSLSKKRFRKIKVKVNGGESRSRTQLELLFLMRFYFQCERAKATEIDSNETKLFGW